MRVSRIPLFSLGPARVAALLFISALLIVVLGISPDGRLAVGAEAACGYTCGTYGGCGSNGGTAINWSCLDCSFGNYFCCNDPGYVSQSMGSCVPAACGYTCSYYNIVDGAFEQDNF